jgi:hypothetical protein
VGAFMVLFIIPTAVYILINLIVFLNGTPVVEISYLGKHIALTFSSLWWFINCVFQKKELAGQDAAFTIHSVIRLIWILVPLIVLWLMIVKSYYGRLLLLPLMLIIIGLASYKKAEETFVTKDFGMSTLTQVPVLGTSFEPENKSKFVIESQQKTFISLGFMTLCFLGLLLGVFTKQRFTGLILAMTGILGFILMTGIDKSQSKKTIYKKTGTDYKIDSMSRRLDSLYERKGAASLEVIKLAEAIEKAYLKKNKGEFPDSLCSKYYQLFHKCREK